MRECIEKSVQFHTTSTKAVVLTDFYHPYEPSTNGLGVMVLAAIGSLCHQDNSIKTKQHNAMLTGKT